MLSGTNLVIREEIDGEGIGNGTRESVELGNDRIGSRGHERVNDGRKDIDEVDDEEDNFGTSIGVRSEESVVDSVVLDELVTSTRNVKKRRETCSNLLVFHLIVVCGKESVDLVDERLILLREGIRLRRVVELSFLGIGENAVVLRVDELDHTVDEITEVVEEFSVGLCNEIVPGEFRVARFWSVLKEVVSPN